MSTTINLAPTWVTAVRIYCEVLQHGDSEDAKRGAVEDLLKLGRNYDTLIDAIKTNIDADPDSTDWRAEMIALLGINKVLGQDICSKCDGKGTLEDGDICDAPCDKCDGSGMACDHVYADDGDPRCINCNEVAS
jgi:hypothetical protein